MIEHDQPVIEQLLRAHIKTQAAEAELARLREAHNKLNEAALNVLELAHEGAILPVNDDLLHLVTCRFDRLERATRFPNRIIFQD